MKRATERALSQTNGLMIAEIEERLLALLKKANTK